MTTTRVDGANRHIKLVYNSTDGRVHRILVDASGTNVDLGPDDGGFGVGEPKGAKTASGAGWDNDSDEVDLGAGHAYKVVRIAAQNDTYIVINNLTADPATEGEFIPAGSVLTFPCAGQRYVHYKCVAAGESGVIGVTAFGVAVA